MRTDGEGKCRYRVPFFFSTISSGSLLLVRVSRFVCRPAQEQTLPIWKRNVLADRNIPPVLGLIALHDDLGSGRQGPLVNAEPEQGVWAATLDHPVCDSAVLIFHVDLNPGVGIHQLPL